MKRNILIISLFLIFCSCQNTGKINNSHYLAKADSILNVYIGPTVNPVTNNLTYFEKNGKKLIGYAHMNDLMFYDIKTQAFYHKIRFQQKGPDGVGNLSRFHIENLDSIYIFTYTHLLIADSSGHVYKRKSFSEILTDKEQPIAPIPMFYIHNNRVVNSQNKLDIACYLMDDNISTVDNISTGFTYDIQRDSIYLNNLYYPSIGKELAYSRDKGNSKYVYSFYLENRLHVISENGQSSFITCKSKYAPRSLSPVIPAGDLYTDVTATIIKPRYYSLLYDKWNKLYYRFFYLGADNLKQGMDLSYYWALKDSPAQFSVMILNEDLQVIGETLIPENTCSPFMYFINEDGLHFALHVNNPDFDPDYLKFVKFTVEKSKQ